MNRAIFGFSHASNVRVGINVDLDRVRREYALTLTITRAEYSQRLMAEQRVQLSRISAVALRYSASPRSRSLALCFTQLAILHGQRINSPASAVVNRPRRPLGFVWPPDPGFTYPREFFLAPQSQRHRSTVRGENAARNPQVGGLAGRVAGSIRTERFPRQSHRFPCRNSACLACRCQSANPVPGVLCQGCWSLAPGSCLGSCHTYEAWLGSEGFPEE